MQLNKHTIYEDIYHLCQAIELLPASELQTKIVTMASDMEKPADKLVDALRAIKLTCLTSKETPQAILGHIIRLCIDAGITQRLDELNVPNAEMSHRRLAT